MAWYPGCQTHYPLLGVHLLTDIKNRAFSGKESGERRGAILRELNALVAATAAQVTVSTSRKSSEESRAQLAPRPTEKVAASFAIETMEPWPMPAECSYPPARPPTAPIRC